MTEPPVVELRGVAVTSGVVTILRDVDLGIAAGETIAMSGPNGAGKTTLLRVMATLLRPSAGSGRVFGIDLAGPQRYTVRGRIGMIGHLPALYPELTLAENLSFAARIAGRDGSGSAGALEAVGLSRAADRQAEDCSYGMLRRAEFARELMLNPELLLLDEPHSALDQDAAELVDHLVAKVARDGGAAVLVSHDRERIEALTERTVEVKAGTVV